MRERSRKDDEGRYLYRVCISRDLCFAKVRYTFGIKVRRNLRKSLVHFSWLYIYIPGLHSEGYQNGFYFGDNSCRGHAYYENASVLIEPSTPNINSRIHSEDSHSYADGAGRGRPCGGLGVCAKLHRGGLRGGRGAGSDDAAGAAAGGAGAGEDADRGHHGDPEEAECGGGPRGDR